MAWINENLHRQQQQQQQKTIWVQVEICLILWLSNVFSLKIWGEMLYCTTFNRKNIPHSFFRQHTNSYISTTLTSNVSKWKILCYTFISFSVLFGLPSSIHQQTEMECSNITSVDDGLNPPNVPVIINQSPALFGTNGTVWPLCKKGCRIFKRKCYSEVRSVVLWRIKGYSCQIFPTCL